jgi:membrane associated rhomboid family serine protease
VIGRHLGGNIIGALVVLAINFVYGFIVPGIAWQAHVGGAVVGALVALVYVRRTGAATRSSGGSVSSRRSCSCCSSWSSSLP